MNHQEDDGNLRVCELCGRKFHALACQDDAWVNASGDVVGYRLPIHEDDELHQGDPNGTACWQCALKYMGDDEINWDIASIVCRSCECARCGEVFAWSRSEHGELLAANNDVVGRLTPDGPICAACEE